MTPDGIIHTFYVVVIVLCILNLAFVIWGKTNWYRVLSIGIVVGLLFFMYPFMNSIIGYPVNLETSLSRTITLGNFRVLKVARQDDHVYLWMVLLSDKKHDPRAYKIHKDKIGLKTQRKVRSAATTGRKMKFSVNKKTKKLTGVFVVSDGGENNSGAGNEEETKQYSLQ